MMTTFRDLVSFIILAQFGWAIGSIQHHDSQCIIQRRYDFEGALQQAKQIQAYEQQMQEYQRKEEERMRAHKAWLEQEQQRRQQERQRLKEEAEQKEQQRLKDQVEKEKCPYTILGIGRDATQDEVKKAYRALSLRYHPDKNPGCELSKIKFTKLVDAYEILGDADRRVLHDEQEFGQYQSRPHNFNSKQGFYSGNSVVVPLNMTEFNRHVLCQDKSVPCSPWMVEFYTPWCVHCKNMIPEWKRAASTMDGTETPLGFVRFGGVNCETDNSLCVSIGVNLYPSIYLYVHDARGQEHVEEFPARKARTVDTFIEFAEKGIRLAHESTLHPIDAFAMHKNVTNTDSTGVWIVLFQGASCRECVTLKASLRRMSANIRGLANFGILDCDKESKVCGEQYVSQYPTLKMYPYQGAKGAGETLYEPGGSDPVIILPVIEKVIRLCIANIEAATGLMNMLHEEDEPEEEPPKPQYQYPEPVRQAQYRVLPDGVRASAGAQYIAG
jgi:thioredoxin-like negative regulator of GroEL